VSPIAISQMIKNNRAGENTSVFFLKIETIKTSAIRKHKYAIKVILLF
jgi:hypothetical protein